MTTEKNTTNKLKPLVNKQIKQDIHKLYFVFKYFYIQIEKYENTCICTRLGKTGLNYINSRLTCHDWQQLLAYRQSLCSVFVVQKGLTDLY